MNQILMFGLGVVVGGVAVWFFARKTNRQHPYILENVRMSAKAKTSGLIEKQAEEKRRNKEAILGLLETQGKLNNSHIEQMLGISDATATRYLDELEKESKVRQVGVTGRYVYYEKVG